MDTFLMSRFHAAVCESLRTLEWVRDAGAYPDKVTALTVPAVYVSIPSWQRTDSNGALNLTLELEFFVVCDRVRTPQNPEPEVFARAAALDLSQWLEGNTFGLTCVEPVVFQDCQRDSFDPDMDDYVVFRLSAEQQIVAGDDPYAPPPDASHLQAAWLGRVPQVGRAHVDDYLLLYRAQDPNDG